MSFILFSLELFTDNFHRPATPFAVKPFGAFYVFLIANLLAASYAPIQDCDETFNYWEPTHYLSHGYGLQTWEYSPEYAIRSWLYIALHAVVGSFRRLLPFPSKVDMSKISLNWADNVLGERVLFHPIYLGLHLRSLPNPIIPNHQQRAKPPDCALLHVRDDL